MKRKKLPKDDRLDWRDPDMPVLRKNNRGIDIEVAPEFIQQYYDKKINSPFYGAPNHRDDETYNLKRKS